MGDEMCDQWAALGRCIGNTYESMFIQCKRSCGYCSKYNFIIWLKFRMGSNTVNGKQFFICLSLFLLQLPMICTRKFRKRPVFRSATKSTTWLQQPSSRVQTIRIVPVSSRLRRDGVSSASLVNTVWRKENTFCAPTQWLPRLQLTLFFYAREVS